MQEIIYVYCVHSANWAQNTKDHFIHNIQHFRSYFLQITYDFINQEIPSAFLPAFDLRSLV